MSVLSDLEIRKRCLEGNGEHTKHLKDPMIWPYSFASSRPGVISYGETSAGYDMRLGDEIWFPKTSYGEVVDPKRLKEGEEYINRVYEKRTITEGFFILAPHSYVLGKTFEKFSIPRDIKGRCTGKSTLARVGILINTTPAEPLWRGYLTVEIGNVSPNPVKLYIMEGIAQMEFELIHGKVENDYESKGGIYQNQVGVTPARVRE